MNLSKKFLFILPTILTACNYIFFEEEYMSGPYNVFIEKQSPVDHYGTYNRRDTISFRDNFGNKDFFIGETHINGEDNFEYIFSGNLNEINGSIFMQTNHDGGYINLICDDRRFNNGEASFQINIQDTLTSKNGYMVIHRDSLEIEATTYNHVLIFDATRATKEKCRFDKLYISRDEGLLRIDLQDSISLTR